MKARLAPLAGAAAPLFVVAAFLIAGDSPDGDASPAKATAFYRAHDSDQIWAGVCLAYAALLFLIFLCYLWSRLRAAQNERRLSSTLAFGGGVMFTLGLTIFGSISFILGDFADKLAPVAIQTLNAMNEDFFLPAAVGLGAFLLGGGAAIVQTGVLPKWLGWVAIVIGVVAVTPVGFFSFMAVGLWLIVAGIVLALRAEPAAAT